MQGRAPSSICGAAGRAPDHAVHDTRVCVCACECGCVLRRERYVTERPYLAGRRKWGGGDLLEAALHTFSGAFPRDFVLLALSCPRQRALIQKIVQPMHTPVLSAFPTPPPRAAAPHVRRTVTTPLSRQSERVHPCTRRRVSCCLLSWRRLKKPNVVVNINFLGGWAWEHQRGSAARPARDNA
jgi:hypothetical protein